MVDVCGTEVNRSLEGHQMGDVYVARSDSMLMLELRVRAACFAMLFVAEHRRVVMADGDIIVPRCITLQIVVGGMMVEVDEVLSRVVRIGDVYLSPSCS
jgi:hypothetical protein